MDRRSFLRLSALGLGAGLIPIGRSGWAAPGGAGDSRLVVVFLRGAVDGLNVVVPYGDSAYRDLRPTIAIARPGASGGALDLDGHFGLHPALASLMPLWQQRSLAFIHASGSPDPTRSHFDAQLDIETGMPGRRTADGWMNRLLTVLPGPHTANQGVAFGPTVPRIMSGKLQVANLPMGKEMGKASILDQPAVSSAFDKLYAGTDAMSVAYRQAQQSRREVMTTMDHEAQEADNGAPPPDGFAGDARRLARLIANDASIQLAFLALGGWDTHVNQGGANGQLANRLKPLGDGLAAFVDGLGPAYRNTVILVVSEFGRTAHENGNGGTDHGHGNAIWMLGGKVAGGRVYGAWPGLGAGQLHEVRDLAVTTDFRCVIGTVAARHLRLSDPALNTVLPAMPRAPSEIAGIIGT